MREINWSDPDFDFGSYYDRSVLNRSRDFTFAHFRVGPGFSTIAGGRIGNKLYYGVTFCSPEDNFSKKFGREHAVKNLMDQDYSHMRGVLYLEGPLENVQPAIILKRAVETHLRKMQWCRPQWSKGATVEFRNDPFAKMESWTQKENVFL